MNGPGMDLMDEDLRSPAERRVGVTRAQHDAILAMDEDDRTKARALDTLESLSTGLYWTRTQVEDDLASYGLTQDAEGIWRDTI